MSRFKELSMVEYPRNSRGSLGNSQFVRSSLSPFILARLMYCHTCCLWSPNLSNFCVPNFEFGWQLHLWHESHSLNYVEKCREGHSSLTLSRRHIASSSSFIRFQLHPNLPNLQLVTSSLFVLLIRPLGWSSVAWISWLFMIWGNHVSDYVSRVLRHFFLLRS